MKTCYQCQKTKPDEEFYLDNRSDDSLTASCKLCQKLRAKDRYKRVPLTEEQKKKKAQDFQDWKLKNPEKYRELVRRNNSRRAEKLARLKDQKGISQEKIYQKDIVQKDISQNS